MAYTQLLKATNGVNRYTMNFFLKDRKIINSIHFGKLGEDDYITTQDLHIKMNFIAGHSSKEDWTNPMSEKTLVKYLLYNKTTLSASYTDYRTTFKYELY